VTPRLIIAAFAFVSIGFSQGLPSYQLIQEVDASGMDSVAGLGTDAQGNVYIAGSTSSQHYPVKNAVQPAIASAGLYRFSGGTRTALGLSSCSALALDPQNPSTIFAISSGVLMKSVNGGAAFASTALPSSQAVSISIQPGNDQILYADTYDQGVLKSADGGATWSTVDNGLPVANNGQFYGSPVWIDPTTVSVIFVNTSGGLARSADGGANWQVTLTTSGARSLTFDTNNPGVLYANTFQDALLKSVDYGQTFSPFPVPDGISEVLPDPIQPGRLIGTGASLYQSTDGGVTWTVELPAALVDFVTDTMNGVYYAAVTGTGIARISANLQSATPVGPAAGPSNLTALAVVNGQVYAANSGSGDVFVTKLDSSGNILYSTYLGGTGNDQAVAMTVDAAGNVFVTGTTSSADFPVSNGAYATSGTAFLFRLNADGSLAYSTYFTGTNPVAVATDGSGSAWLLGNNIDGGLPVTPGALATTFCCFNGGGISIGPPIIPEEATLTRFTPSGSGLTFSTYVPGSGTASPLGLPPSAAALVVAPDGSAYVGAFQGFFRIDPTGSTLLSSLTNPPVNPQAMALGPDGSLYIAGTAENFQTTQGAFETTVPPIPMPSEPEEGIVRLDPMLRNVLAATFFGAYAQVKAMTTDAAGNLYIGGSTAGIGLPTRTPLDGGFADPTGFMSELSGDLSSLLFSSYFGDTENFTVSGVGIGSNGSVWIAGATNQGYSFPANSGSVWVNSLALTPPPALRIDSVENAASFLDGPVSAGETIVINGAGFGSDAQLTIGGAAVSPLSIAATSITAIVPAGVPAAAAAIEVQSGGASTNQVLMPVAVTAPGIFAQSGAGYGQGYILNHDGTLNAPSNPAAPGDRITIFATGVGPMTFTQCCAVTEYPVNVYIDGVYCDGVAAIVGQVNGLPGSVYQITVYVPNPVVLFANSNPPFVFPPLDSLVMQVNGVSSQTGITISIAQ
jgi:uncharacterized protein (TIGR03437 family)